jgi:hypothetical protein
MAGPVVVQGLRARVEPHHESVPPRWSESIPSESSETELTTLGGYFRVEARTALRLLEATLAKRSRYSRPTFGQNIGLAYS